MDKTLLKKRINILKGQLDGILRLVEEDQDCLTVLTQMKAVKSSLGSLGEEIITNHCRLTKNLQEKELAQLLQTMTKY